MFAGPFTAAAVTGICTDADAPAVLGRLDSLVDKCLVTREGEGDQARFRLLETVRAFGLDQLRAAGAEANSRNRHLLWYADLAEAGNIELEGPDQPAWLERLELEHDNIRAALAWSRQAAAGAETGLRLAVASTRFWLFRSYLQEGWSHLSAALAVAGDGIGPDLRARGLLTLGVLAGARGDYAQAKAALGRGLTLARELGDAGLSQRLFENLGNAYAESGELETAREHFAQALQIAEETGIRRDQASSLQNLGTVTMQLGALEQAQEFLQRGTQLCAELGDQESVAYGLYQLGRVCTHRRDLGRAGALLKQALTRFQGLGDRKWVVDVLEALALAYALTDEADRAARLLGAAQAQRDSVGVPLPPCDVPEYEQAVIAVKNALGEAAALAAIQAGQQLDQQQAVALALGDAPSAPAAASH